MNRKDFAAICDQWAADLYEQMETDTEDVELLLELIGPEKRSIIEIACGGGRILVPLAKAGHTVFGIDRDGFMLRYLAQKCVGLPNMSWANRDAIAGDWGGIYDVVVIGANFLLNIVSDEDYGTAQRLLVQKAYGALRDGGHLFLDFNSVPRPEEVYNRPGRRVIFEGTDRAGYRGAVGHLDSAYDPSAQRVEFVRWYDLTAPDGARVTYECRETKRIPRRGEVLRWAEELGFTVEAAYGAYDRSPMTEEAERTILWLKK